MPNSRRRFSEWLLFPTNNLRGCKEPDARGPGGDLWTGGLGHYFPGRRRSDPAGQRNYLRPFRRNLDARHYARAPFCEGDKGRRDLDQYLQHVQCGLALRWLQAVRLRQGNGQACARDVYEREERMGGSVGQADWLVWEVAGSLLWSRLRRKRAMTTELR